MAIEYITLGKRICEARMGLNMTHASLSELVDRSPQYIC